MQNGLDTSQPASRNRDELYLFWHFIWCQMQKLAHPIRLERGEPNVITQRQTLNSVGLISAEGAVPIIEQPFSDRSYIIVCYFRIHRTS
jgi:hypothetical protein